MTWADGAFASRAGVMYAGKLVEEGPVRYLRQPASYTRILMESLPSLDEKETLQWSRAPPSAADRPAGCVFTRCPFVMDRCIQEEPLFREVAPEQRVLATRTTNPPLRTV